MAFSLHYFINCSLVNWFCHFSRCRFLFQICFRECWKKFWSAATLPAGVSCSQIGWQSDKSVQCTLHLRWHNEVMKYFKLVQQIFPAFWYNVTEVCTVRLGWWEMWNLYRWQERNSLTLEIDIFFPSFSWMWIHSQICKTMIS